MKEFNNIIEGKTPQNNLAELLDKIALELNNSNMQHVDYDALKKRNEEESNIECRANIKNAREQHIKSLHNQQALNKKWTFTNMDDNNPAIKEIKDKAKLYLDRFFEFLDNPNLTAPNLLITGGVGSGKSHTAGAIANVLIANNIDTIFTTFDSIMTELLNSELSISSRQKFINAPILVIDDLVTKNEPINKFYSDKLSELLRYRINLNHPTIVISMCPPSQLSSILGEHTFGAIQALRAQFINLKDTDLRDQRGYENNSNTISSIDNWY